MSKDASCDQEIKALSEELRQVRQQLATVQQQSHLVLRMLSTMMNKLNELSAKEGEIEHEVGAIEKEISQLVASTLATGLCPSCGGPLSHHPAASGELRICTACGFSQFVDAHGVARNTALPAPLSKTGDAAVPPTWVG